MESKRQQKFGRQIQKDLSEIFQKEFKEVFGGAMVTITDVKISPDLSLARCYLSFLLVEKPNEIMNELEFKNKAIRNALANRIRKQVRIAMEEANAIIFMVDVATGITDLDDAMADMLRRTPKPVYVVVNKVDNGTRELEATEFYSLGFEHTFFISSTYYKYNTVLFTIS